MNIKHLNIKYPTCKIHKEEKEFYVIFPDEHN